ncbi:MAG: cobyrinic acid a,c-diamide synthase [Desulfobacteraceae bacterium 4572_35.1]|nr:MAG: cobyrinic acid a,c-diamide synthase [Desulfobacteraceae bacterium 4572_35.1]
MAKKIFVAATGQNCGKSTVCLSLLHRAAKKYKRIGFIKPIGPKLVEFRNCWADKDAVLMAQIFNLENDIRDMSPVPLYPETTREVLDGKISPETLGQRMVEACRRLEEQCDFLVIEGAGHAGVGSVIGYNNAQIAKLLNAPVMIVSEGGIGSAIDAISLNLSEFKQAGIAVRLLLGNKLLAHKRQTNLHYLNKAFAENDMHIEGGFNYSPILANPTLNRISRLLNCPLQGNEEEALRIVHTVQLGSASSQRVADLLEESTLLLVHTSRDELMVMMASLYHLPEYRHKIAGMVIAGYAPVSPITLKIVDDSNIPYIRTQITTAQSFSIIKDDVTKTSAEDKEKIDLIRHLAEVEFNFDKIDAILNP